MDTKHGPEVMHFAVIGDPCEHPEKLHEPFVQPFDGRETTLARDAPELKCRDGRLKGATYSDHGHVIIGGVFEPAPDDDNRVRLVPLTSMDVGCERPLLHATEHLSVNADAHNSSPPVSCCYLYLPHLQPPPASFPPPCVAAR